jgi:uncharacterized protein (DUF433 family)
VRQGGWVRRAGLSPKPLSGVLLSAETAGAILGEGGSTMANLDWSQCPAVESIPGKVGGAWVFRDTRLPVATVIENLEDLSVEEVMEQFDVTRVQIAAVLEFVAQSLKGSAPGQAFGPVDAHSL